MRQLFGVLLMIAGVLFGVWAGVWWAFIGGIVDVITEIRATDMSALNVAIGVAKILFAGLIGWLAGIVAILPGWLMVQD